MKKGIFAGSFDPFTLGHLNTIEQARYFFDHIIIAIAQSGKKAMYSDVEKTRIIFETFSQKYHTQIFTNSQMKISFKEGDLLLEVISIGNHLTGNDAKKIGTDYLIRGIRNHNDLELEKTIMTMNNVMFPQLKPVFFVSPVNMSHISSTIVRDLLTKEDSLPMLKTLVSPSVIPLLLKE